MTPDDYDQFDQMMQAISAMYGREMTPGVVALYWQGLRHLDLAAVREALNRHVANPDTGQFMPKIADVNRMIGGTTQDAAIMAWAKVDKAVRMVGTYEDVAFDDPLIHRVIADLGGWVWLGLQTEDEWPFVGKRFEALYRGYKARSEVPEYQTTLTGIANAQNAQNGFRINPPKLIGNPGKAKAVLLGGTSRSTLQVTTAKELLRVAS